MNNFSRPVPQSCPSCSTPITPRVFNARGAKGEIIREARWVCDRCGSYFHRAPMDPTQAVNSPTGR